MKLARRPSNRPIGATAQVRSPSDRIGDAAPPREQHHRRDAAGEAAVERHAALPELENLQRVRGEMRRIVEQHVAEPAAEDDAERDPQHEVVEVGDASSAPARPTAARLRISARA